MREAIEQLIEDYERRYKSAEEMLTQCAMSYEQYHRVKGKIEAYRAFRSELKAVLANGTHERIGVPGDVGEEAKQIPSEENGSGRP